MRCRFLFALLLVTLTACTFHMEVLTPTSPDLYPTKDMQMPTGLADTPFPFDAPPPYPTPTYFPPTIVPSPLPGSLGIYPIQFGPDETYVDVVDTILVGTSKTYSVTALKGQVMSVSTLQSSDENWAFPMRIVGADGTTLCQSAADTICNFWRGVLPATQDYFVTLTPVVDMSNFDMRVAINTSGTENQFFQYVSRNNPVFLRYSDEFAPARNPEMDIYKFEPELALQFIDTSFFEGTDLLEAYFLFGASSDDTMVANCYQPPASLENEEVVNVVIINGRKFAHSEWTGVWTGHIINRVIYRTIFQNTCYEVTFLTHFANAGNYVPELKEFDRAALMQKFESILSTITID